ncbi:uncharacterized protein LOC116172205 isoform X2 [Photinus pyralis]|uniref:uncharacterized protein LOC116172205 isoform X2 n=1 Tax=Photinus pyralis TaxID=7054 RepID=UPI0012677ED6|nr:uncharacterized protein LOC116172205 isoform X2 [Photinus pyralis]
MMFVSNCSLNCLLFHLTLLIVKECHTLKSVIIYVPEVVKSGDTVTLSCDYDLEQAALYTIKWYRDDVEFYRFVPKESPPSKAFSVPFINVDISRSGSKNVTLRGVRRELTGHYKCEVSADAPLFHTEIKSAHMLVAELPIDNPSISIDQTKVEIGKQIQADCSATGSDPAANLTWYINEEEVTEDTDYVKLFPITVQSDHALGLHSSRSRIEIIANKSHFSGGLMVLKCEANLFSLWHGTADRFIRDETPQLAPVLGSTSSQSHTEDNQEYYTGIGHLSFPSSRLTCFLIIPVFVR